MLFYEREDFKDTVGAPQLCHSLRSLSLCKPLLPFSNVILAFIKSLLHHFSGDPSASFALSGSHCEQNLCSRCRVLQ